ncbi:MAG: alpha/beta hydrolase family protein [Acidobacteria bacterium]|nr:alpha/beta hydrolase family protein [Acidobacteriota bacterium]
MRFFEDKIRRYEHARWTTDDNRRVYPFVWGLEHIGGPSAQPKKAAVVPGLPPVLGSQNKPPVDPASEDAQARAFLDKWVEETVAKSTDWFGCDAATDYVLEDSTDASGKLRQTLRFTSAVDSPWEANNTVTARWFPAKHGGPAVVVLSHWNAKPDAYNPICRWLNALGISALRMTMPYHDSRIVEGHERADQLVGTNIGLTLQANRQAVLDTRRCLRWLEQRGYGKLGLLGTSIGSSIAFITMAHDPAVRAAAFLHCSTYFGDVVRLGMTTSHVWEGLRNKVTADEIRRYWLPISPVPYVHRVGRNHTNGNNGHGRIPKVLAITGLYDPTFIPELSEVALRGMKEHGLDFEYMKLPCGHYSLGEKPFSWIAGGRFGHFLFQNLT